MVAADFTHAAPAGENDATICGFTCFAKSGRKEQSGNSGFLTSAQKQSRVSHNICLNVCLCVCKRTFFLLFFVFFS